MILNRQTKPFKDIPSERKRICMPESPAMERVESFGEVEEGFSEEQARSEAERCLSCRGCLGCGLCDVVCQPKAVNYAQEDEEIEFVVDTILITPGMVEEVMTLDVRFGYGRYTNVITGLEFAQMLNERDRIGGLVIRPSDGDIPVRLAILVCETPWIFSNESAVNRNDPSLQYVNGLAELALSKVDVIRTVAIYPGKMFCDRGVVDNVGDHPGLEFRDGEVISVKTKDSSENLVVKSSGNGDTGSDEFDMVVLCLPQGFSPAVQEWGRGLGLDLGKKQFSKDFTGDAVPTGVEGVFLVGSQFDGT